MFLLVISTALSYLIVDYFVITALYLEEHFLSFDIPYPYNLSGLLLTIFGLVMVVWSNFLLLSITTKREPFSKPVKLITNGPYKYSRNPLYMGVIFFFLGLGILLNLMILFALSFIAFLVLQVWFTKYEENKLEV